MPIVHCLEQPNSQFFQYEVIQIEGWAFSTEESVTAVKVRCGGKTYAANIGLPREDVGKCHPDFAEHSSTSGFRLEIKLKPRESARPQKIRITIVAGKECLRLEPIMMFPRGANAKKTGYGIMGALRKAWGYFRAGKFPKNISEWKRCLRKFYNVLVGKPGQIEKIAQVCHAEPYELWQCKHEFSKQKRVQAESELISMPYRPLISVIMPAYQPDRQLFQAAIQSVLCQVYTDWELIINDDCSPGGSLEQFVHECSGGDTRVRFHRMVENSNISVATNVAVSLSGGEFLFFMDHDDTIEENALFEVVKCLNDQSDVDILYSDDDKLSMDGKRYAPQFKPDYSPELLLSFMYFSHIFVIRRSLFEEIGGCRKGLEGVQDYDLALRAVEKTDKIIHIPEVLYHWRAAPTSTALSTATKPQSLERGIQAVQEAVYRRKIMAEVVMPEFAEQARIGIYSLKYCDKTYPLVSIVIPTKNHVDILKRCLDSIVEKTTYPNYEIILVDNCSDDGDTLAYYKILTHKIVRCENVEGKFNFSRMVNLGVKNSSGSYVVLLNNDTEVITPSWLEDMLVYCQIPGVGICGCKLLYADGTVQHAGVVLQMLNGVAGHAFKLRPDWDGGHMSFANTARNYSAVTAACLMVSRVIYQAVGGFNETDYAVSYNDVDFCLRVQRAGYRVVYNPEAKLYHYEGKSRGVEQSNHFSDAREEYNLIHDWKLDSNFRDPYYNPNLSLEDESFALELRRLRHRNRKRLNVLLITHNLNYEGAPLVQFHVAQGLSGQYNFMVLSPLEGPLRTEYEASGIPVKVYTMQPSECFDSRQALGEHIGQIQKQIERFLPDMIYTNTIETFWGVELGSRMGLPTIWGIHESVDYNTYFSMFPPDVRSLAVNAFCEATKVVFVANATAALYESLDTLNFITIRNGVDLNHIEKSKNKIDRRSLRAALNIAEDETVISIFGTVCFRKGQKIFAQAAKLLLERYEGRLKFLIVGAKDCAYLTELRLYITENHLEADVEIIPACDNVRIFDYYAVSDYFVCASYEESAPQVILEAMAFELPIVSTNVFGIPEQIRNGAEALLVEPGSPDAIAEGLLTLLKNPALAMRLADNGKYRLKSKFTKELMLQQYDQLFQEAYGEGANKVYERYIRGKGRQKG